MLYCYVESCGERPVEYCRRCNRHICPLHADGNVQVTILSDIYEYRRSSAQVLCVACADWYRETSPKRQADAYELWVRQQQA